MAYGIPTQPIPVLVEATKVQQKANKNTGIGGRILDIFLGAGTGSGVGEIEAIVEVDKKPDYTPHYVVAGVIVLLGGIYFFTRKKK